MIPHGGVHATCGPADGAVSQHYAVVNQLPRAQLSPDVGRNRLYEAG